MVTARGDAAIQIVMAGVDLFCMVTEAMVTVHKDDDVRFAHESISNKFISGRSFDDLIRDLDRGRLHP